MIHGYFDPERPPHGYVDVAVSIPALAIGVTSVRFLLDTGAARTCIHPLDAVRQLDIPEHVLRDPPASLARMQYGGIGGRADYFESHSELAFFDNERGWITIQQPFQAALLRPLTRRAGLSLGDRACLALGMSEGREVLTADTAWGQLPTEFRITLIRHGPGPAGT